MAASCWRSSAPTRRASTLHPVAPRYSTLLQIDPYSYPNVIGDAASEWTISPDGLTYTFKIRQGIRFHDGSTLTAADVKATYDKIVFPPGIEAPYPSHRGVWWTRNVVHWAKMKNYVAPPSQFANQKLQDVWLSED